MSFNLEKNINRIKKLCNIDETHGDAAMAFLAIYSFFEGYISDVASDEIEKYLASKDYKKSSRDLSFCEKINSFSKYRNLPFGSLKFDRIARWNFRIGTKKEFYLLDEMIKYHGSYNSDSETNTNGIRHNFDELDNEKLAVVIRQFVNFAKFQKFTNLSEIEYIAKDYFTRIYPDWNQKKVSESKSVPIQEDEFSLFEKIINEIQYEKSPKIDDLKRQIGNLNLKLKNSISSEEETKIHNEIFKLEIELENLTIQENKNLSADIIKYFSEKIITVRNQKEFELEYLDLNGEEKDSSGKYANTQKGCLGFAITNLTQENKQNMLIKGGPGTGKTLVLISILKRFIELNRKNVVLLTYYDSLEKYIQFLYGTLYSEGEEVGRNKIQTYVKSFSEFMFSKMKDPLGIDKIFKMEEENADSVAKAKAEFVECCGDVADELFSEAYDKIWPNLLDEKKYIEEYKGSKNKWEKIQEVQDKMKEKTEFLDRFAYYQFCKSVSDDDILEKRDYILVDETQDLTNAQISAVGKLCNISCIFSGDLDQSIRKSVRSGSDSVKNRKIVWKDLGIVVNGNYSKTLKKNCRSSIPVQRLGKLYHQYCNTQDEETTELEAYLPGLPPQLCVSKNDCIYKDIVKSIKICRDKFSERLSNICVVAFSDKEIESLKVELKNEGIKSARINDENYKFGEDEVRLSIAKYIKGIDCQTLIFLLDDRFVDEKKSGISSECLSNAIYTCITRAMYFLQVFMPEETFSGNCEPIKNLIEVIKTSSKNEDESQENVSQKEQNDSDKDFNSNQKNPPKKIKVVIKRKKSVEPQQNEEITRKLQAE